MRKLNTSVCLDALKVVERVADRITRAGVEERMPGWKDWSKKLGFTTCYYTFNGGHVYRNNSF